MTNTFTTIGITSCGRYRLLKKTIRSLGKNCVLSDFKKILTEDSLNEKHIKRIKKEQVSGFLQGWEIIYTGGVGKTNQEKHYHALISLYKHVHTPYVFHCEDDWMFKKIDFDFLNVSQKILYANSDVGIIQMRDFKNDGGYNHLSLSENTRKNQLFEHKQISYFGKEFFVFRNDDNGDLCKGFSLNPGLRRTNQMKELMFGYETSIDEGKTGQRMKEKKIHAINFKDGIVTHIGNSFFSTKIKEKGVFLGGISFLKGAYNYRIKSQGMKVLGKIYQYLEKFTFFRKVFDYISYIIRKKIVKEINPYLLKNTEGIESMNIDYSWFTEKKKSGISGVARLRNSDDFLLEVIESHIPFLNEIILVDNVSSDSTKKKCLELQKKYPEIIRFYSYPYDVKAQGQDNNIASSSIFSLAYFYNWCFSKSTYKYVMKIDDDNLLIKEEWDKIHEYTLQKKPEKYIVYHGINILKKGNKYGVCSNNKYVGKYGDHGIYPVSKKTYYVQDGEVEKFLNPFMYKRFGISFFHLKFLKKDFGLTNYISTTRGRNQLYTIENSEILEISSFLKSKKIITFDNIGRKKYY